MASSPRLPCADSKGTPGAGNIHGEITTCLEQLTGTQPWEPGAAGDALQLQLQHLGLAPGLSSGQKGHRQSTWCVRCGSLLNFIFIAHSVKEISSKTRQSPTVNESLSHF